jgi:hypothetical protein
MFTMPPGFLQPHGGGSVGAWDPADVAMDPGGLPAFTFADADARISNPVSGGNIGKGTCRSTTSKTSGLRYVEIVLHAWGGFPFFGLAWGFSSTPDAYNFDPRDNSNKNAWWRPNTGGVNSYGTTNGSTFPALVEPLVVDDVYRMGIDIGTGLTFFAINGDSPTDVSAIPFTEADVKVFIALAAMGGGTGDSDALILTTGSTQMFAPFASHAPWDGA